jgi:hypothetical protein
MLLVIFGAGASYDSVPHRPPPMNFIGALDRPPLANELFGDRPEFVRLMERFGGCRAHIPRLRRHGVAVEQELAKLQSAAVVYPKANSELASILYYIRYAIDECERRWRSHHRGITNYVTLLREIDRWRHELNERVLFVTFNYDTMLESAIVQELKLLIGSLSDYISQPNYRLIKLHGSTNWGRTVDVARERYIPYPRGQNISDPGLVSRFQNQLISDAQEVTQRLTDQFHVIPTSEMLMFNDQIVFPAIALPIDKKDEFSCPDDHVKALADWIPGVTKILTIGWRATETKFLEMLRSRLTGLKGAPQLLIVSGSIDGARETFDNLGPEITKGGASSLHKGFSGLIIEEFDDLLAWLRGFLIKGFPAGASV